MKFLYLWLFSLKVLRVLSHHQPHHPYNGEEQVVNEVEVVDYNAMGRGTCPKIKQPLCATNGEEVLYFDNKCLLEVRNFEQLMQGLKEYFECPLSYCGPQCAPCGEIYEPVCAVDVLTGKMENFPNPCEVERKICFTQREHRIMSSGPCPSTPSPNSKCPQFCTLEFMPVCAQFQTELRQFPNQCQLDKEKCETNKDWHTVDPSYCAENTAISPLKFAAQESECPEFCTLKYQPICARFMTLEKEFSNECELKTTICQTKQKWDIIRRGPCQETKAAMALDMIAPIRKCPEFCTLEYDPICAKFENELREFANKCELETTKCRTMEDWQIIEQGPCPSVSNIKAFKLKQQPKCPLFCTLEYRPICAQFEEELREFGNKCELEVTICESGQNWQIVRDGPCSSSPLEFSNKAIKLPEKPKCPQFCTLEYSPICAQFNNELREFSNKCDLESTICLTNQKWEVVHQGTCESDPVSKKPKCPQVCTAEYRPICAQFENELREFSNNCDLARTICETDQKWQIVKEGTCFVDSSAEISECPQFCTKDYRPVCAEFKGEEREFANKCLLLKAICESNKKWELVKLGPCSRPTPKLFKISSTKCPKFCTREFDPVCAKLNNDLREFSNKCVLDSWNCETNEKWELVSLGPCPSVKPASALLSSATECPKFCTREFDPVCAKLNNEMTEFSNKCVLDAWNCESNEKWELVNKGPCPSIKPASALISSAKFGKKLTPKPLVSCPKFCTKEYNPVCAKFDEELREFSNRCELLRENCETNTPWVFQNSGPCTSAISAKKLIPAPLTPPCPQFCTDDLRPVCAEFNSELREFGNRCEMQVTICQTKNKWKIVNEGPCPAKSKLKPACPKFCTKEFSPVCARFKGQLREFPNKCEFQRSLCETNIAWELINNGPCLIKNFETDSIELQPICATDGKINKMFNDPSELQEDIRKTGVAWSLLHNDECLTPPLPLAKVANKAFILATEKSSTKSATTTTPKTTTTTTSKTTRKPKTTTSTTPKLSTTKKTTPKHSTTIKPRATSAKTSTTVKPQHTTTSKTITATTTTPKTTSTVRHSTPKTTTTNYPRYSPTPSSSIDTHNQCSYDHSTEIDSAEIDDSSKGYHEHDNYCGCGGQEDFEAYSEESFSDEDYISWEDDDDEEDVLEEDEDDTSQSSEVQGSYTIDDNAYTYKHNKSNSTYTFIYGKGSTNSDSEKNDVGKKCSEKMGNNEDKKNSEIKKQSNSAEPKGKQVISSNHNLKSAPIKNVKETPDSLNAGNLKTVPNTKLGNSKTNVQNNVKKVDSTIQKSNQKDLKLLGDEEGINIVELIQERLREEDHDMTKQKSDSLPKGNLKTFTDKTIKLGNTNGWNDPKSNRQDLKLLGNEEGINLIELLQERLGEEFESQEDHEKPKPTLNNKGSLKTKQNPNRGDLKLLGDEEGINLIELLQERLGEEFESQEDHEKLKPTQIHKGGLKTKQRDQIKPNLAKTKLNSKTKDQVQIKPKLGKADLYLSNKQPVQIVAKPEQPKLNTNSALYFPESNKDAMGSHEEHYENLAQPNHNLNTEQQQFQTIRNHGQSELNSDTDLYIPQISGNLLDNTNLEQPKLDTNSVLYSPEYYEGPKDIVEDTFADVLGNFHDKDQSLEANISSEEEEAQQETTHSFGPVSLSEKQPKFGVYSDEAYGLMDSAEVNKNDEWSLKNQPIATEINTNKDFHSLLSDSNYEEDKISEQNKEFPKYSTQPLMNNTENAENILEVFEALLSESDAEEEDNETLVKQVLTTIGGETTAAYPSFEDMDTQSNYTKREEYPAKYNSTYSKKGEIYNGAVYKAPVYDAPTYNFIYTAPNHPVLPLMPPNHHPFLNYPGFRPQYTDPAANPYNSFVPLVNQTNFGVPTNTGSTPNNPFNPLHFLNSLAAMSSPLGSSMPNLMPLPQASEYYSNNLPQNQDNPLNLEEPRSQEPVNPSSPAVFNQILPQTHPSPHMFLPPPPEPFLNSFSPLANIASQIPNALPLTENIEPSEENNSPNAEGNEMDLPQYPYPAPPLPIYNNPVNPQMQQPLPLLPSMASNALPNLPFQPMPYPYPAAPLALPPPAGSLPLNIFNATLFHQIAETLKTITSRY